MKRKANRILIAAAAVLAFLGMIWVGIWFLNRQFVFCYDRILPRNSKELDISGTPLTDPEICLQFPRLETLDARGTGMTPAQYQWFREHLPNCRILWDVPIQGQLYPQDIRELTVEELSPEDLSVLDCLTELTAVDVGRWGDYAKIRMLQADYPALALRYQIQVAGEWWNHDAVSLIAADADPGELSEKLPLFSQLESVLLTGNVPSLQELSVLQEQFPQILFLWKMDAFGMALETDITRLNLSGIPLADAAMLEDILPYLPVLEQVDLGVTTLDPHQLSALIARHPDIQFLFCVNIGAHTIAHDVKEMDISNTPLQSTGEIETLLPCFPNLEKVIMCECGISDEEMDALNRRHENIRFVWSVDLGGMLFRTDAIHFTPNRWGLKLTTEDVYPLRYCTDMVCVDIGHQLKVTNCDWAAFMPNLKYLILAETSISDLTPLTGLSELIYLELFLMPPCDLTPLTTLTALEDLNLCYTQSDPTPVGEMTWLKRLWWSGRWAAQSTLPAKLENTHMEFLSPSSTGKGWRDGQNYFDMRDLIGMEYMTG